MAIGTNDKTSTQVNQETMYVDASGLVAGRLASLVAKRLLLGQKITVFNVALSIVTGKRLTVQESYMKLRRIQSKVNPRRHGPFTPKTPKGIFRKMVRGMLPSNKAKGKQAFRRLKVYAGCPEKLRDLEMVSFPEALHRKSPHGYLTLEEIARHLGWRPLEEKSIKELG